MPPIKPIPATFVFEKYETDFVQGTLLFSYRLERDNRTISFQEKIFFPPPTNQNLPQDAVEAVSKHLFLLSGIGYWKAWCPNAIELPTVSLTPPEAQFWNAIYTKGLGEFYYRNNIDFRGLVNFPATAAGAPKSERLRLADRSLLLVGGGKDSIVSEQLLKRANKPFDAFALSPAPLQTSVMERMGKKIVSIKRELDPALLTLNAEADTYNGHIPISVFYALHAILAALLYDYRSVVASNEHSANYGNTEYLGMTVNHQWSKSLELELMLQTFIHDFISPDLNYFSLLRPFSEIKIVSLFVGASQYYELFSSCNRNFKLTKEEVPHRWCGQCAKCAFVFALLAAFLEKNDLLKIFGKNLFADPLLVPVYRDLLGLTNMKPFDCVGTPEETALAFLLAQDKGHYNDSVAMQMFLQEARQKFPDQQTLRSTLLDEKNEAALPSDFRDVFGQ